jgi:hypothetical protein
MTSPVLQEAWFSGGFLISEANGFQSRDAGMISNTGTADVVLDAGLVLTDTSAGTASIVAGTNTGNGTLGSFAPGGEIADGTYVIKLTAATTFAVAAPNGDALPAGTVGTAYADAQIGFTVTAGGTAFVAGDSFTITVRPADLDYVPWTGTGLPSAILFNRTVVPASGTKKATLITRNAEVNAAELRWDPAVSGSGSFAALKQTAQAALLNQDVLFR